MSLAQPPAVTATVTKPDIQPAATESAALSPVQQKELDRLTVPVKTGLDRAEVMALLAATGLPITEKSSTHVGPPQGSRIVVPRSNNVTKLFGYLLEDVSLPGYVAPADRKARRLGKVSVVADITTLEQVKVLIAALLKALGLSTPPTPPPAKATSTESSPPASSDTVEAGHGEFKESTKALAQMLLQASGHAVLIRRKRAA